MILLGGIFILIPINVVGIKSYRGIGVLSMKISTKGRYGLRAMVEFAVLGETEKCVSLKTISDSLEISDGYLEQLVASLKKSGLIKGIRGAQGGYVLSRDPSEITVGDILRALEGDLSPSACANNSGDWPCKGPCEVCSTKGVWEKIFQSVNDVVDTITLKTLADEKIQLKSTVDL